MTWWAWIILGVALLCVELFAIDAQFYLVFIGISAILVGVAGSLGPDLPPWIEWLSFAVLSVLMMFTVRRHLYEKVRGRSVGGVESDVGERVAIAEELPPGKSCRAEYRGSFWTAVNVGSRPIPAGGEARIEAVDGLTLHVRSVVGEE